jgi:hypothetical protein
VVPERLRRMRTASNSLLRALQHRGSFSPFMYNPKRKPIARGQVSSYAATKVAVQHPFGADMSTSLRRSSASLPALGGNEAATKLKNGW